MSDITRKRKRVSKHPYLTGNFAPVTRTHSPTPCTWSGKIPSELLGGQYVRNGGNPITNSDLGRDAHWFDGDGMLAGVLFQRSSSNPDEAVPHFVNKYILTDLCISSFENASLKTPILPSIATLVNPISSLVLIILRILRSVLLVLLSHVSGSQQAIKRISVANTAIYFHDGRALATCESGPPMRIQLPGLETVGWFDGSKAAGEAPSEEDPDRDVFGGSGVHSFMKEWTTGHPKVDPQTGEMILYHCNFVAPYVHYSVLPPESTQAPPVGRLLNAPVPGCSGGKMMHDFGVSLRHTVILDLPLTLTPFNLLKNQPIVSYDPNAPARFGLFPRHQPSKVRWFETHGCCIFHTANTWDELDDKGDVTAVHMLTCRYTSASIVFSAGNLPPPPHPERRESIKRRRMSFFARYDEDEHTIDPEKVDLDEKVPLLSLGDQGNYSEPLPGPAPPILDDDKEECRLYYHRFDMASRDPEISHQFALSAIPFEFPTVNPAHEMSSARYVYGCSVSNMSFGAALGKAAKIDVLAKVDVHALLARSAESPPTSITGCVDSRTVSQVLASTGREDPIRAFKLPQGWYAQEARFVSRADPASEDDGYLLFYAFDESQVNEDGECRAGAASELWILDARNMEDVVARVRLPQRVPYGLHGNWFTEEQIRSQREVQATRSMPSQAEQSTTSKVKRAAIGIMG